MSLVRGAEERGRHARLHVDSASARAVAEALAAGRGSWEDRWAAARPRRVRGTSGVGRASGEARATLGPPCRGRRRRAGSTTGHCSRAGPRGHPTRAAHWGRRPVRAGHATVSRYRSAGAQWTVVGVRRVGLVPGPWRRWPAAASSATGCSSCPTLRAGRPAWQAEAVGAVLPRSMDSRRFGHA